MLGVFGRERKHTLPFTLRTFIKVGGYCLSLKVNQELIGEANFSFLRSGDKSELSCKNEGNQVANSSSYHGLLSQQAREGRGKQLRLHD